MGEARIRKEKHKLLNSRATCKNCGGNDTFLRACEGSHVVECLECWSSTGPVDSAVGAVKAWNEGKVGWKIQSLMTWLRESLAG